MGRHIGTKRDHISARSDSGIYEYLRRVPKALWHLTDERLIKFSLGTRDEAEARLKARAIDESQVEYWRELAAGGNKQQAWKRYQTAVKLAQLFGFSYMPAAQVAALPAEELRERTAAAAKHIDNPKAVEAIAGGVPPQDVKFSELWGAYYEHHKIELVGKSRDQLKRHRDQREYVIGVAQEVLGDKGLSEITRPDALRFRQHMLDRVLRGEITKETANRVMSALKGMISIVDDALQTSFGQPWENLRVRGKKLKSKRVRPPYDPKFIRERFLAPGGLEGLNIEARMIVYMMIETGARPTELCNLRPQDINLDTEIPFISVSERDDREQKTLQSIRTIPLVGCALWAAKQCKNGFPRYHDRSSNLSATVNKFLLENGLRPSTRHVLYSIRHTFQDRLTATGAPDRLQTDIFGHEFEREKYGSGSTLKQKLDLLEEMKFEWKSPSVAESEGDAPVSDSEQQSA